VYPLIAHIGGVIVDALVKQGAIEGLKLAWKRHASVTALLKKCESYTGLKKISNCTVHGEIESFPSKKP
jgi:hypothetical protein